MFLEPKTVQVTKQNSKVSEMKFLKNFVLLKCHTGDISRKNRYLYFFESGLSTRDNFETDICCVEFLGRSIGTIR